jgi:hypothetical protein
MAHDTSCPVFEPDDSGEQECICNYIRSLRANERRRLADAIEHRFTPHAWNCTDGNQECAEIRRRQSVIGEVDAIWRISQWLRNGDHE